MPESQGQLPVGVVLVPEAKRPGWRQRVTVAWHAVTRRPTWLLGVAGLALLAASVVRVIGISSGAGLVTVVVAGAVLLVSPFVIARVQRFSVSPSGFEVQLAQSVADLGAPKAARILDRTDLAKFAESYAFVHSELEDHRYYDAKIHLQDLLVERAAAVASSEKFDATEVRTLFTKAAPTMRVLALGLMQGDLSLADGPTVLAAVADPRSSNEQFQGLKLAKLCWRRLSRSDRAALKYVIKTDPDIEAGANRRQAAQEILDLPDSPEGTVLGT
ncbi:MAG TPA: hypothetical protein VHY58_04210 [Streptosporangiaceae bacterium]|jgi:hypothetical protein|nr:hypothetical protein [Streptosporangiaceae bacterium]